MPNALQILSREGTDGSTFFLYQEEMVDCNKQQVWKQCQHPCYFLQNYYQILINRRRSLKNWRRSLNPGRAAFVLV